MDMRRASLITGTLTAALVLAASLAATSTAIPATPATTGETSVLDTYPELGPDGDPVNPIGLLLFDVSTQLEDATIDAPEYAGVTVEGEVVTARWAGEPPQDLQELADRLGERNKGLIEVKVERASFASAELAREGEKIGSEQHAGLVHVGPNPDGSGLLVGALSGSELAQMNEAEAAEYLGSDYPVAEISVRDAVFRTNSRQNDAARWTQKRASLQGALHLVSQHSISVTEEC